MKPTLNLENFKDDILKFTKKVFKEEGRIEPIIFILVNIEDKNEIGLTIMPIPNEVMKDNNTKLEFLKQGLPQVKKQLSETNITPISFCFCSEVWIRKLNKASTIPDNWRDLPKTEGIALLFSDKDNESNLMYTINRDGLQVNSEGNLEKAITLEFDEESSKINEGKVEGIFSNLYKQYQDA